MPIYMTPEGIEQLKQRMAKEETELASVRKEKAVAYTQSGDQWHDNPGFNQLEQAELRKLKQIAEMHSRLADAVVVNVEPRDVDHVSIGSIVRYLRVNEDNGESQTGLLEIVGFGEGNPQRSTVSYNSPLGMGLMGLNPGESRTDESGLGIFTYEVLALYPSWEAALDDRPSQ